MANKSKTSSKNVKKKKGEFNKEKGRKQTEYQRELNAVPKKRKRGR